MSPGDTSRRGSVIDLTRESDFRIGEAAVRPSRGEVAPPGAAIRLQPRVMQVLVALARADGAVVSREALVEQCWGQVVIGDDALNRCIVRLRRLAEETGGAFSIETLPRLGYRLMRNEGAGPDGAGVRRAQRWARYRPALAGAALAVLVASAVASVLFWRSAHPSVPVVALAPFTAPPGDASRRALAVGIDEDVAAAITAASFATVVRQTSDGGGANATFVLGGSLEGDNSQMRAHAQLVQRRDHRILWAGAFTRPAATSGSLRAQVAAKLADILRCAFDGARGHVESDTLALFLRACDGIHDFQKEDETRDALQQVVRRQPRFAKAIGMMAIADSISAETLPPGQDERAKNAAKAEAERALQLDASQPDAFVALANLDDDSVAGRARAVATLRRGISLAPDSPELNNWLGGMLLKMGYVDAALRYGQRAADLDPFTPLKPNLVIRSLAAAGRIEDARKVMDQTAARWPDTPDVMLTRITLEMEAGDAGRAVALLTDPANRPPIWTPAMAGLVYHALMVRAHGGDIRPAAAQVLALLRTHQAGGNFVTRLLLALGDVDDAFAAAAAADPKTIDTTLLFEPAADPMRRDPRFPSLARRLGLVGSWRAERHWPDFCSEPGLPYDCSKL